jgi:hypothetical protein
VKKLHMAPLSYARVRIGDSIVAQEEVKLDGLVYPMNIVVQAAQANK